MTGKQPRKQDLYINKMLNRYGYDLTGENSQYLIAITSKDFMSSSQKHLWFFIGLMCVGAIIVLNTLGFVLSIVAGLVIVIKNFSGNIQPSSYKTSLINNVKIEEDEITINSDVIESINIQAIDIENFYQEVKTEDDKNIAMIYAETKDSIYDVFLLTGEDKKDLETDAIMLTKFLSNIYSTT